MKLILLLMLFVGMQGAFAQELMYKSGGRVYTASGEKQAAGTVKEMLAPHPDALALYKTGRQKKTWAGVLIGVGVGFAAGYTGTMYISDEPITMLPLIGVGVAITGISVRVGYSKKIKSALAIYNEKTVYDRGSSGSTELSLCASGSGVGIKLSI